MWNIVQEIRDNQKIWITNSDIIRLGDFRWNIYAIYVAHKYTYLCTLDAYLIKLSPTQRRPEHFGLSLQSFSWGGLDALVDVLARGPVTLILVPEILKSNTTSFN